MKISVIADDKTVIVNNEALTVDADFPARLHAIQYQEGAGEIELKNPTSNIPVLDYEKEVEPYVEAWQKRKAELGFTQTPKPDAPAGKRAVMDGVEKVDGEWRTKWLVRDKTAEEIEQEWQSIRSQRDQLLTESDWTQMPDSPLYQDQAWLDYRKALRDLPQNFNDPDAVVWPEKPN